MLSVPGGAFSGDVLSPWHMEPLMAAILAEISHGMAHKEIFRDTTSSTPPWPSSLADRLDALGVPALARRTQEHPLSSCTESTRINSRPQSQCPWQRAHRPTESENVYFRPTIG